MNKNLLFEAKEIARKVHGNQTDKKRYPYMSHILDVASRVSHLGENYEITGLLHDAIEDASKHPNGEDFKKEITNQIEKSFNKDVIEAIQAMTKLSSDDYFNDYLPRIKRNEIAKQVKIADSSHNLSKAHLLVNEPDLQDKLRKKYIKVLNELGEDGLSCEKPIIYKDEEWVVKK
ncbi:HD domain-containing protein [Gammaproteobacteria bacterium]|nr:HD domain-containing protein [Gammaproteobacteria bacterium]